MNFSRPGRLLYYAYGSNLHPARLGARIPSSQLIGVAELSGYQLAFHKRGADLSGKCNAVCSSNAGDTLLGALFSMNGSEKPILDKIEGAGYVVSEIVVTHERKTYQAFMYVAQTACIDESLLPYQWYKDFVSLGAQFLCFSDHYLKSINSIAAIADDNAERHARNEKILRLMR